MNSSPPPPSFTLPPLNSAGQFPITPDDSPASDHAGAKDYVSARGANAGSGSADGGPEPSVRLSMYVKLFDEMIKTVLESETYLFTARELWVLRYILALPYEPLYLLTRLLLRRPGRILPFTSLSLSYSSELGDEGVKRAMAALSRPLPIPADILAAEPVPVASSSKHVLSTPQKASLPARGFPTPVSIKAKGKMRQGSKPWDHLETGLTEAEEKADPELAAAIRESLWAAKVGRVEIDDDGVVVPSPPPSRPSGSRSVSGSSASSSGSRDAGVEQPAAFQPHADFAEEFSLSPRPPPPLDLLARDESRLSLDEIMSCISAEELRKVARARKVPLSALSNREAVQAALRGLAKKQTVLGFAPVVKGKGKTATSAQSTLPFSSAGAGPAASASSRRATTSETLLISSLLPLIGNHAIQLTPELHGLVARVNLIFSRTPPLTATSSSLMLPSILVTSNKRRYPDYGPPTRSIIWKDRDELMVWERAVHWEAVVADALGDTWAEQRRNNNTNAVSGFGVGRREMPSRVEGAKVVKRVWEGVWTVWKQLVEGDGGLAVDAASEQGGLVGDRFKTGHVLTRIVYKGATALGILHEYDQECMVLRALLKQRRWRRGKRGAWHDRLALVLMNHYNASDQEKFEKRREATQVCIDGLLDEDTHLIYRPGLSRRLTRLENKLDLPADERHISYAELLKCETRELLAPRVKENMGIRKMRPGGRAESVCDREASLGLEEDVALRGGIQQVGKSVWVGREGEVTVEGWVLEWWEKKGYKGFHSEGSILTTLFGLLLWPVLFHPLPGAFETPYQTAPLDLGEDTFAPSRQDLLETRLEQMSKTRNALEMLREADERERAKQTWAVGVSWEYGRDDLAEVLECLGGRAMAGICRMLAEEYRHRVSGVPDLIVWNYGMKEARFVEVKGPGDNLSETQKVWIDVLLSSGVQVEVCRVRAKDPSATDEKRLESLASKRKAAFSGVKSEASGSGRKKTKVERAKEEYEDAKADLAPEHEDEWAYESGEEGKAEGHWDKSRQRGVSIA